MRGNIITGNGAVTKDGVGYEKRLLGFGVN